jgi:hypothetical protein
MRLGPMFAAALAALALVTIGVQAAPLFGGTSLGSTIDSAVTAARVTVCESSATESYCKEIDADDDDEDEDDDDDALESLLGDDDDE